MIDLYALPNEFPGAEDALKLKVDPYKWVEKLEANWRDLTNDRRFLPFIALHEYETYLFTDVTQFKFFFDDAESKVAALKSVADGVKNPEWINDGQHTAPSKRIIKEFPEYESAKTTFGPQIAESIGLEAIRKQCPHFENWLSRLEVLGKQAGID